MRQSLTILALTGIILLTASAAARVPAAMTQPGGRSTDKRSADRGLDDRRIADGYEFLGRLKPDRAIACFTGPYIEALADSDWPKAARYLELIALGFRFDENHEACLACCRLACQLDRHSISAQIMEADTLTRMRRLADADEHFKRLMPLLHSNELVARAAGNLAAAHIDLVLAHTYLKIAESLDPEDWRVHEFLARLNYDNDSLEQLRQAARYAPTPYAREMILWQIDSQTHPQSPSTEHLDRAAQLLPNEPSWRTSLGWRLAQTDKDKRAFELMTQAVQCPRLFTRSFSQFALYSAFQKRPKLAAASMDYLQKLRPDSPEVYVVKAQLATDAGDWVAAEANWRTSLKLNPCQSVAWAALGALPRYQNNTAAQDEVAAMWTRFCPQDAQCYIFRGQLCRKRHDWDRASADYQQARRLLHYMESRKAEHPAQWLPLTAGGGTACYKLGDRKLALQNAIEFNQLKPDNRQNFLKVRPGKIDLTALQGKAKAAAEHGLLADMLFETGELDDCVKEYQAALALEDNSVWHNGLLKAYIDKRDFASASKEDLIVANHALTSDIPQAADRLKKTLFHEK